MKKKLLSLVAATALIAPTLSYAIGLGSVRTYSHLNERLRAEIPVLSVKKKGRISATLASNAEFAKRGVQRTEVLNDLRFSVVKRGGRTYINVSSAKQIAVPYLNFILQLDTPEGVVSREYAIFLDPASVSKKKRSNMVVGSPYRTKNNKLNAEKTTAKKRSTATPKSKKKAGVAQSIPLAFTISNAKGGRYGPVAKGATLWSIAQKTRPSPSIPVNQMVEAIRRANPKTLANGLPAGVMLNIPTLEGHSGYSSGSQFANQAERKADIETAKASQPSVLPVTAPEAKPVTGDSPKPQPLTTNSTTKQMQTTASSISDDTVTSAISNASPDNAAVTADSDASPTVDMDVTPKGKSGTSTAMLTTTVADELGSEVQNMLAETETATENAMTSVAENTVATVETAEQTTGLITSVEPNANTDNLPTEVTSTVETAETTANESTVTTTAPETNAPPTVVAEAPAADELSPAEQAAAALPSVEEVKQFVQDNAPAVGGAAAAVGLGGLLLLNRRRKAKSAVLPATTSGTAVAALNEDAEDKELEALFSDVPEIEIHSDTVALTDESMDNVSVEQKDTEMDLPDELDLNADDFGIEDFVPENEATVDSEEASTTTEADESLLDFVLADEAEADKASTVESPELSAVTDTADESDNLAPLNFDLSDGDFELDDSKEAASAQDSTTPVESESFEDAGRSEETEIADMPDINIDDTLDFDLSGDTDIDDLLIDDNFDFDQLSAEDISDNASPVVDSEPQALTASHQPLVEMSDDFEVEDITTNNAPAIADNSAENELHLEAGDLMAIDEMDTDITFDTLDTNVDDLNVDDMEPLGMENNEKKLVLDSETDAFDISFSEEDDSLIDVDSALAQPTAVEAAPHENDIDGLLDLSDMPQQAQSLTNERISTVVEQPQDDWLDVTEDENILIDFAEAADDDNDDILILGENEAVKTESDKPVVPPVSREAISSEAVSRMQMKLDLANSFISISESARAKALLLEIIQGGSEEQANMAQQLLDNLPS